MRPRIQKWRIRISILFAVFFLAFLTLCESVWETRSAFVATALFFVGILLVAVASLGRAWCALYIVGYKKRVLVTEGPYSISRNPLYFFSLTGFLGVGLCTETLLMPALLLAAFALYYPPVIRREEASLREVHAEAFDEYTKSTPRLFPRVSNLHEPDSYVVNPILFRRHVVDAMVFIWCVGLLEIIEELHELGWIESLFSVY